MGQQADRMQSETPTRSRGDGRKPSRLQRWTRLVAAVVLVPYLAHFAYTRYTTMPPGAPDILDVSIALRRPAPDVDRTEDLIAAIETLPGIRPLTVPTTAPAGKRWVPCGRAAERAANPRRRRRRPVAASKVTPDPDHLMSGEWAPSRRFLQGRMLAYLKRQDVDQALNAVAALGDQPFCLAPVDSRDRPLPKGVLIAKLLAARARAVMAEGQDLARASRDLQALLHLAAGLEDDGAMTRTTAAVTLRQLALNEAARWTCEYELPATPARDLTRWLMANPYDARRVWRETVSGLRVWMEGVVIDERFTCDRHGDGWYVARPGDGNRREDKILRALNLLAPFFNDRRTVMRGLRWQADRLAGLADVSYQEGREICRDAHAVTEAGAKPTEIMLPNLIAGNDHNHRSVVATEARHRLAAVMMAVAAFRAEHGRDPSGLDELIPDYFEAIPIDPFSGSALRYRIDSSGRGVVYAVGDDGRDDGGESSPGSRRADFVLGGPRGQPYREWTLVDQEASPQSDGAGRPK